MRDEEGHAGDEEPEAGSAKFVEEGEGTLNLLDFGNGDFVGDAVMTDFELDALDGVAKEFVSVFYIVLTDEYGVFTAVGVSILRYIDTVILHIIYI